MPKNSNTLPLWAIDLKCRIDALQNELAALREDRWRYYDFINRFRRFMRPDPDRDHYPEVILGQCRIGVTFDGLLYDKDSGNTLERSDAFEVYRMIYEAYRRSLKP